MIKRYLVGLVLTSVSSFAVAHHSTIGFYDPERIMEITGVLKSVSMRNPHIRFVVTVTGPEGEEVDWNVESASLSTLQINGLDQDFMRLGERISVAGQASRRNRPEMSASNVLLEDGTEVMLLLRGDPYFTRPDGEDLLDPVFDESVTTNAQQDADGIFRVWSSVVTDRESFPIFKGDYPLTADAERERDNWDPASTNLLGCYEKGMPLLMITPLPVEFVQTDDDILMRFQVDDAVRVIHMGDNDAPPDEPLFLGYSTGRWEGDSLVVETSNISATEFDGMGVFQSSEIALVESFTLSEDEHRLDYRLTVHDPATFSRRFDLTKYWAWRPEIAIQPWDCDVSAVPEDALNHE